MISTISPAELRGSTGFPVGSGIKGGVRGKVPTFGYELTQPIQKFADAAL
jgi:hypothetical protein